MSDKLRASFLSLTIIAVLVFSAVGPTIAYADGGTTTDAPTETSTSSDQAAVTTSTPAPTDSEATSKSDSDDDDDGAQATAVPTDPATVEATATPAPTEVVSGDAQATATPTTTGRHHKKKAADSTATEAPTEAAPATDQATTTDSADSSVLNDVPDNTTVTVLDANGESQPLATQDTAEAIATTTDPIWCPGTQAPTPGANGCTDTFTSFDALLTFLSGNATYSGTGTIYVQQGAYQGSDPSPTIDFNSYNLSNISNADLTITGGWNTSSGVVDPTATSDFTNTAIVIGSSANPWVGSLTVNNITMSFDTTFSNDAANLAMNGLTLYSQGNVSLNNVSVTNAPNDGADITAGGDANVSKSNFERNQKTGVLIKAGRNANIGDSSFSNPTNGRRQETGLDITSAGSTSLFNVLANNNRVAGANINAGGAVSIGSSFFSGTKLMQGSGASATFLGYGLQVVTPDIIQIDTVTASDNFLWGASLQAGGNIAVANSVFNANTTASPGFIDDTGLIIKGGGNVALDTVTANQNRKFGAVIDATGTVSVNNSTFSNNNGTTTTGGVTEYFGHGLKVTSLGIINLNNVIASNDMLFGAQLNSGADVNIANSTFSNCTTCDPANALGVGLDVVSVGNTSLLNVVLDKNQTVGANISSNVDVYLDTVTATNNGTDGVHVQKAVCTHVNAGEYSGNGQYGLNLGPSALDLISAPTFANNGAGDIFPANPVTCTPAPAAANTSAGTPGVAASNIFTSLKLNAANIFSGADSSTNMSLSSFLANSKTANGSIASIFFGKYGYIYSDAGFEVFAFAPATTELAMSGS